MNLPSSGPRAYPEELLGADEGGRGEPSQRPQGQGEDSDIVVEVEDSDVGEDSDVVEDEGD